MELFGVQAPYLEITLTLWAVALVYNCLPPLAAWIRACLVLRCMPGPPGGLMGQLKHFNNSKLGYHKIVCQWARQYGGIYRVRLANVNVRPLDCTALHTSALRRVGLVYLLPHAATVHTALCLYCICTVSSIGAAYMNALKLTNSCQHTHLSCRWS